MAALTHASSIPALTDDRRDGHRKAVEEHGHRPRNAGAELASGRTKRAGSDSAKRRQADSELGDQPMLLFAAVSVTSSRLVEAGGCPK